MKAAIVSEYRKFFSTRMWWVLTLVMVVFFLAMSFGISWTLSYEVLNSGMGDLPDGVSPQDLLDQLRPSIYSLAPSMGYIFPVIVGALAVTAEYRHNTILPTFIGEPRRWVVMIAKAVAGVPMGFAIAVAGTAACLIGGSLGFHLGGAATQLLTMTTLKNAALSVVALTIWALVGVGLGMLIINQVGVIISVLTWCVLIESIVSMLLGSFSATDWIPKFLPSAASGSLAGGTNIYITLGTTGGSAYSTLSVWQGGLVMVAYGVVFGLLGYFFRIRRDVS